MYANTQNNQIKNNRPSLCTKLTFQSNDSQTN